VTFTGRLLRHGHWGFGLFLGVLLPATVLAVPFGVMGAKLWGLLPQLRLRAPSAPEGPSPAVCSRRARA